jgi:hypothetical protein
MCPTASHLILHESRAWPSRGYLPNIDVDQKQSGTVWPDPVLWTPSPLVVVVVQAPTTAALLYHSLSNPLWIQQRGARSY